MGQTAILYPLFVQIALTFALLFWMGGTRVRALRSGAVGLNDIALGEPAWPGRVAKIGNSFHSQFELPILFYVVIALALLTGQVNALLVGLAWAFVAARIVHAAIHTSTNEVPRRFTAFSTGALILLAMWLVFAFHTIART